jgi:hypothetical protein
MLFGKGNADDCITQQDAKEYMGKEYPDATDKNPDEVHEG